MRILISPYRNRVSYFVNEKGERVFSHRYREMRDGINAEPAQDLKDDPEVISILNELDILERESRPSLGADSKTKDRAAREALAFAGGLLDNVAGWAIDHQRGLAQRTSDELKIRQEQFSMAIEPPAPEPPDEGYRDEREGASRSNLDPVQARRFLANFLRPMPARLVHRDVIEAIEALDYGETLPIFQKAHTSKRTGLIEYRAKLRALMFIEYESKKGIKKRFSFDKVVDAFAVTSDAVKDWRADLRIALGAFHVEAFITRAQQAGQEYVDCLKAVEDGQREVRQRRCKLLEQLYGKHSLLREAERFKARSKKVVRKTPKIRG